ncbi:hypothetical protein EYC98_01880 [Halieaceae bacterium IMCC14734]|uniref:DUF4019 domain-containing protein n=1 Tax=Candidatus Litorirhabdus singularis TaxID=2518993 RepID=A0ABT3TCS8_9GAMM|nr:hypothetical protein [Candidatus Litorirhabdus singularis]MCX2979606.1 hypothetical protein [Candidatus Litorirhabdus singularis]
MNKMTNVLLGVILLIGLLNLALTASLAGRQSTVAAESVSGFDNGLARRWGDRVTNLYNRGDHAGLYTLFNQQAKVKISGDQLESQLEKLRQLFGDIEESAFQNSMKLGEKGGEQYYQLHYSLRVTGKEGPATMRLSLVVDGDQISLYGLTINATESL